MDDFELVDVGKVPIRRKASPVLFKQFERITKDKALHFNFKKLGLTHGGTRYIIAKWNKEHPDRRLLQKKDGDFMYVYLEKDEE